MRNNKTVKTYCRKLWAQLVKHRDGNKCIICGGTKGLNAHHLISKKIDFLSYNLNCGVTLCSWHHTFSPVISAHSAAHTFEDKIMETRPEQHAWLMKYCIESLLEKLYKTPINHYLVFEQLLEQYKDIDPEGYSKDRKYDSFKKSKDYKILTAYYENRSIEEMSQELKDTTPKEVKRILKRYKQI